MWPVLKNVGSNNTRSCPILRHWCSGVKRPHRIWRANHLQSQPPPLRYPLFQIKTLRVGPAIKQSSIRSLFFPLFGPYCRFKFIRLVSDPAARLHVFEVFRSDMTSSRNAMWSYSRRIRRNVDTTVYTNPENSVEVMTLVLGVHIP